MPKSLPFHRRGGRARFVKSCGNADSQIPLLFQEIKNKFVLASANPFSAESGTDGMVADGAYFSFFIVRIVNERGNLPVNDGDVAASACHVLADLLFLLHEGIGINQGEKLLAKQRTKAVVNGAPLVFGNRNQGVRVLFGCRAN